MAFSSRTYVYIDILFTLGLFLIGGALETFVEPTKRSFNEEDPDIGLPFIKDETVSSTALICVTIFVPLGTFVLVHFIRRRKHHVSHAVLGLRLLSLAHAFAMNFVLTTVLKLSVGELRPDFLDRCQPVDGVCTGDDEIIKEGRKSFPSGHASVSFSGMVLLSLILAFELSVLQTASTRKRYNQLQREHGRIYHSHERHPLAFVRLIVAFAPVFISLLIAVSRIVDNRHHPHDVIAGGIIGSTCAAMIFYIHHQHGRDALFKDDEWTLVDDEEAPVSGNELQRSQRSQAQ